jgi:hypothetical protein
MQMQGGDLMVWPNLAESRIHDCIELMKFKLVSGSRAIMLDTYTKDRRVDPSQKGLPSLRASSSAQLTGGG